MCNIIFGAMSSKWGTMRFQASSLEIGFVEYDVT